MIRRILVGLACAATLAGAAAAQVGPINGGTQPAGPAGGDLAGSTYPNPVVAKIGGVAVGTAATKNTGTSGATIPLLNGTNTFSALQTLSGGATSTQYLISSDTTNPVAPSNCAFCSAGAWNYIQKNITGTQSGTGAFSPDYEGVNDTNNAEVNTTDINALHYWAYTMKGGWAASRYVQNRQMNIVSPNLYGDTSTINMVNDQSYGTATASVGGTDTNSVDAKGALYGADINTNVDSGATNWALHVAEELDVAVSTGASTLENHGQIISLRPKHASPGIMEDAAMVFSAASAATAQWRNGVQFGGTLYTQPFNSSSVYEKSTRKQIPTLDSAPVADRGTDFRETTFSTCAFMSQGYCVDPNGNEYGTTHRAINGYANQTATVSSLSIAAYGGVTGGAYFATTSVPTLTIQASPGGGTQAAYTVNHMKITKALMLTTPTGAADGDVYTLTGDGTAVTHAQLTLHMATFTGNIALVAGVPTLTVTSGPTGSALAAGMELDGTGLPTGSGGVYIASGSGSTWYLSSNPGAVASTTMHGYSTTITTAGSYTAPGSAPTVNSSPSETSVATFNFGYGIVDFTQSNAGTLYSGNSPPVVWTTPGGAVPNSRNTPALIQAQMTSTTSQATFPYGISFPSNITANTWGSNGVGMTGASSTYTDATGSGTLAQVAAFAFPQITQAMQTAGVTGTNVEELFIPAPLAGTNLTATNLWSAYMNGGLKVVGTFNAVGGGLINGAFNLNVSNNAATNIGTGTTNQTVSIGGGSDNVTVNAATATVTGTTNINASNNAATNIGTGSTTSLVTIGGGSNAVTIAASAGNLTLSNVTTGTNTDFMCMASGNKVTLQTSSCTISSRRFKEAITPFSQSALAKLKLLPVVNFKIKATTPPNKDPNATTPQVGLLAEDVAKIMPQCSLFENDMKTPKSYRQECVIALLVKGEQELMAKNAALEARVARLEKGAAHRR